MYFKSLRPHILIDNDKRYGDSVILFFELTLRCPICNTEKNVITKGLSLGTLDFEPLEIELRKKQHLLTKRIRDLNEVLLTLGQQICDECGVVSVLPGKSQDELKKQALSKETKDEAIAKLITRNFSNIPPVMVL